MRLMTWQVLHVMGCQLTQATRFHNAFDDVANTIHQTLGGGSFDTRATTGMSTAAPTAGSGR